MKDATSDNLWDDGGTDMFAEVAAMPAGGRKAEPAPLGDIDAASRHFGCPVWWLQGVLPVVTGAHQLAVAIYLFRRCAICGKRKTFDVPNGELKTWGIARQTKYRTLELLAAAGLIRINRRGKAALTVTLLLRQPKA